MKIAIAEYLWGRVWFFHFLKGISRHHFIKSNWHYVRSIEDLVPKSSFSYKQFLVHPDPKSLTRCWEHNMTTHAATINRTCSDQANRRTGTYDDTLWYMACEYEHLERHRAHEEICMIYWMAPFVDEYYRI